MQPLRLSVLDFAFITAGSDAAAALRRTLDLAQHVERWGYTRFWLAEHHNMVSVASAATSVVIGFVAGGTRAIRVGSGGIMLPNHAVLAIAEQFGTLESLYPGRIDLGVGRAPGTDLPTQRALRRSPTGADDFPRDVADLQSLFGPVSEGQLVQAVPGANLEIPLWILGSSLFGAQLAGELGLPFAFASHFMPADLMPALDTYRRSFKPSRRLKSPYAMAGVNVIAANSDHEARVLFTSAQQQFTNSLRGIRTPLPPPIDDIDRYWTVEEKARATAMLRCSFVGDREVVRAGLTRFAEQTNVDEIIVASAFHDHAARLRSYEILADVFPQRSVAGLR